MARWKGHIGRGPAWASWKAAAAEARDAWPGCARGRPGERRARPRRDRAGFRCRLCTLVDRPDRHRGSTLRGFLAVRHQDTIDRFRAADARACELAKQIVRARLGGDVPPPTAFGSDPEWGTLARELVKKTRHMPLRQLFGHIPTALTRLTPCVMMSPLSIAQYLPAEAQPFDVVLFDEASQIPVWDAIGRDRPGQAGDRRRRPAAAAPDLGRRAWRRRRRGRHRRHRSGEHPRRMPGLEHSVSSPRLALSQPAREPDRLLEPRLLRRASWSRFLRRSPRTGPCAMSQCRAASTSAAPAG